MRKRIITPEIAPPLPTKRFAEVSLGEVAATLIDHGYTDMYRWNMRDVIRVYRSLYLEGIKENEIRRKSRA